MLELIKQFFTFLSNMAQLYNNTLLINAGKSAAEIEQTEKVLDDVQKADDIRLAGSDRTDNFFVCAPDSARKK